MSILRRLGSVGATIGRVARSPVGSVVGRVARGIPGVGTAMAIGSGVAAAAQFVQQRSGAPQPPALVRSGQAPTLPVPGYQTMSGFAPSSGFVPMQPPMGGPTLPQLPPPGMGGPMPVGGPSRPVAGGPGFVQTGGTMVAGRILTSPMARRLAGLFRDFMSGLGIVMGLDAALEIIEAPIDVIEPDTLAYLQQFAQSPQARAFMMMQEAGGDPRFGPMVLPAGEKTIKDAPRGYVIVVDPVTGEEVAMRKDVARMRGLWKAPSKPPISAREWKSAMSFKRVQKKMMKFYKLTAPKIKTVYGMSKPKRKC